jgi:hypothetical protein
MRLVIYTLFPLCLQCCVGDKGQAQKDIESLKDCDEVTMVYYNHNDTLTYVSKDTLEIGALTELFSGAKDIIGDSCKPSGQLIYKSNGNILFTAEFSSTDTNEDVDCNYVVYKSGDKPHKHKLTYRAGMFIDDIFWGRLKWSSVSCHGPIRLHGDTGTVEEKINLNELQKLSSDSIKYIENKR